LIKRLFKNRINEIKEKFKTVEIILENDSANFIGQQSRGYRQVRGNGVLILTKDKIYFEMWKPKKVLEIQISSIQDIEIVRSFLGKSKFRDLLRINFANKQGEKDAAAWLVFDLGNWLDEIKRLI
jgi:hypothetical protein